MLLAALAAAAASPPRAAAIDPASLQDLYRLDLRWLDDRDRPFGLAELAGTPAVLTLAYGACRRICSTALRELEALQALADRRGVALQFVVVGIDPSSDRPADWADFRRDRGLQRANWHFLTGDDAAVRRLATRLGVHYWRAGEHVMHDYRLVLVGPEGRLLRSVDHFGQPIAALLP